jgi:hypothetical protein
MVVDNSDDDNATSNERDENFDFKGSNPLNYKIKSASASSSHDYSTQISVGATIMQQLNSELVDAIDDDVEEGSDCDQKIQIISQQYQDFLLDSLENENAVMVSWFYDHLSITIIFSIFFFVCLKKPKCYFDCETTFDICTHTHTHTHTKATYF